MSTGEGSSYRSENFEKPEIKLQELRILVVDCNLESLLHVTSILKDLSHEVTVTEGAHSAFEILEKDGDQYDLVIADTNLLGIQMVQFVEAVRRIKDIPIIMMFCGKKKETEDSKIASEAKGEDVCVFYKKPVSFGMLSVVCQKAYGKKRYRFEAQQMVDNRRAEHASLSSPTVGCGNDESQQPPCLPGAGNPVVPKLR